jgi:MFS family permease
MKYISYIEIVVGMGLALGPCIGSVFYSQLRYAWTMYMFGFFNAAAMILCYWFIPSELNKTANRAEVAEFQAEAANLMDDEEVEVKKKAKISWCTVLKNRHFTFAVLTCFIGTVNLTYF